MPVYDQGHCVEIYGRRIQKYPDPKHLYLPGPHAGVWNPAGFMSWDGRYDGVSGGNTPAKNTHQLILCEALIDAMTFWVNGFKSVTASYGTGGFTDQHLVQIKAHGIDKVLIAYDRDQAGNAAAEALAKKLKAKGIHCYRILFPKGTDVNSYAVQVTPADKSLALVIEKAEPMEDAPALNHDRVIPALAAGVVEASSPADVKAPEQSPLTIKGSDIFFVAGSREYRIRGLSNNTRLDQL